MKDNNTHMTRKLTLTEFFSKYSKYEIHEVVGQEKLASVERLTTDSSKYAWVIQPL